jgi:hypothetical protein
MAMSVSEALRDTYANVMRVVSTEASTTAQSNEACLKDVQLVEVPGVMVRPWIKTGGEKDKVRRVHTHTCRTLPVTYSAAVIRRRRHT